MTGSGLLKRLEEEKVAVVVMEASGGYERLAAAELSLAGIPTAVVNPRQVRDFARGVDILAKTDKIDAQVLAQFGEAVNPRRYMLPDKDQQRIRGLMSRRIQLVEMLDSERKRLARSDEDVVGEVEDHIRYLKEQLKNLDEKLDQRIRESPIWSERAKLLREVPGVGRITILTLFAVLPELGHLDRKKIASLAGLAPFNRDSGTSVKGRRTCWAGRLQARKALYMATLTATRFNPVIKAHYQQLVERGKPPKVAMVACMRKLLTQLNAMARDGSRWQYKQQALPAA